MRTRLLVVVALTAALTLSLVAVSGASAAAKGKARGKQGAALMRTTSTDKAVVGTSLLRWRARRGGHLTGWVVVTGLAANSTHAWHIHGRVPGGDAAPGNCTTQSDPVIVAFDDLVANEFGVAIVRVNVTRVGKNPLLKGNYVNIHESSSADGVGPGIVCGMIKKAIV